MNNWPKSKALLNKNEKWIPGGVVSLNRKAFPNISFLKGKGSRVWDLEGNEYIDYQAGFASGFLGHNDPDINEEIRKSLLDQSLLMGAGPTKHEGELAELFCKAVPTVDSIQITCTGSEATYHAIRISRAVTGRDHIIIIQGGYNGWHNDVAGNVINKFEDIGERVSPGEYPYVPISGGVPGFQKSLVHVINFNDLESVAYVIKRYQVSCIIIEPILQNIGIVKPKEGYLAGLRKLADENGFLLIFDEVKTGFRHSLGGYQSICGVTPDLSTFGKAVANGYPIGVIAGKKKFMDYFIHPDPQKRVLIAGTFNAHPVTDIAAITTLKKLASSSFGVYEHVENLGKILEEGLKQLLKQYDFPFYVARERSAFCVYFMDHAPQDFHDILAHHNYELDTEFRINLIKQGVFNFPNPTKQGSISYAHSENDIEETLDKTKKVLSSLLDKKPELAKA